MLDAAHDEAMAMFAGDEEQLREAVERMRTSVERVLHMSVPLHQLREAATAATLLAYAEQLLDEGWHVVECDDDGHPSLDSHDAVELLLHDIALLARRGLRTAASMDERMRWSLVLRRAQVKRRELAAHTTTPLLGAQDAGAAHTLTHTLTAATNAPPAMTASNVLSIAMAGTGREVAA